LAGGAAAPAPRPAAVAFTHYTGVDRGVSEGGAARAAAVLDRLVRAVQEAVDARGVTFLATDIAPDGGKMILTAGVPQITGNDEEQMLLALRRIAGTVDGELPIHIGVNWGHVFAGSVGPAYRRTYTVMGDAVNLAARLMAKAPVGEVYATQGVLDGSRTTFQLETPDPFFVKGKKLPIQAYSVGPPEGTKAATTSTLPLIGRDIEIATMLDAWGEAFRGSGRVIELTAEPGLGKTRLLQELLARSAPDRLVRAECRLYQAATPYFPFRALLRSAWGIDESDQDDAENQLDRLVQEFAPTLAPWRSLIGVAVGFDLPESPEVKQLDDQFRPARTVAAVGALLEATIDKPTMFIIEDTHWMDDASRELLGGLLMGLDRLPWLIVLTRRPGDQGFVAPEAPMVRQFRLEPLDLDHARSLINAATERSPLSPHQVDALARRADGSPLFLIELLQALRQGGDVEAMPKSVEGLIGARIDKLPPNDRHLLRRVAVLGTGFRLEHTAAVLKEEEAERRWQLHAIRRLDDFLTIDRSSWIQFRHALIRDVAYQGLPFRTRVELHARVGDSICSASGGHPDTQAELLSLHYFYARHWEDAWHFSRIAGDRAKEIYANVEAGVFFERALKAAQHLSLPNRERGLAWEALGEVREQAGGFSRAIEAFSQAARFTRHDPVAFADLTVKRARARMRTGSYRTALSETSRAYSRLVGLDNSLAVEARARLASFRAFILQSLQRPRETLAAAERAAAEARAAGEREALARAYTAIDWAQYVLGAPERGAHSREALRIYQELGDRESVGNVMNNIGAYAYLDGNWPEAVMWFTRSQEELRKAGNDVASALVATNIGEVLVSQGRIDEAEPILEEALRVLRAANDVDEIPPAEIQLTRVQFDRGDHPGAVERLQRVLTDVAALGQEFRSYEVMLQLASFRVRDGDPTAALGLVAEIETRAGREAVALGPRLAWVRAQALAHFGRAEDADAVIEQGLRAAAEHGLLYEEALLRTARREISGADGENAREASRLLGQLGVEQAAAHL
ncbi:MAG: ATP-binding protein, partial [Actinomycetota bacterium]